MNPVFYHDKPLTITYGSDHEGKIQSWGVKITPTSDERTLVAMYGRCITESQRDEAFSKLKEDEQRFIISGYLSDDEDMPDADGGEFLVLLLFGSPVWFLLSLFLCMIWATVCFIFLRLTVLLLIPRFE